MADAPVLGAGSSECGFKSHLPHQNLPSGSGLNAYFPEGIIFRKIVFGVYVTVLFFLIEIKQGDLPY